MCPPVCLLKLKGAARCLVNPTVIYGRHLLGLDVNDLTCRPPTSTAQEPRNQQRFTKTFVWLLVQVISTATGRL